MENNTCHCNLGYSGDRCTEKCKNFCIKTLFIIVKGYLCLHSTLVLPKRYDPFDCHSLLVIISFIQKEFPSESKMPFI